MLFLLLFGVLRTPKVENSQGSEKGPLLDFVKGEPFEKTSVSLMVSNQRKILTHKN